MLYDAYNKYYTNVPGRWLGGDCISVAVPPQLVAPLCTSSFLKTERLCGAPSVSTGYSTSYDCLDERHARCTNRKGEEIN